MTPGPEGKKAHLHLVTRPKHALSAGVNANCPMCAPLGEPSCAVCRGEWTRTLPVGASGDEWRLLDITTAEALNVTHFFDRRVGNAEHRRGMAASRSALEPSKWG